MKFKALAVYQYVRFNNRNENFFSDRPGMEGIEMEAVKEVPGAVRIKTEKDCVIIFFTNIAYAIEADGGGKVANRGALKDQVVGTKK